MVYTWFSPSIRHGPKIYVRVVLPNLFHRSMTWMLFASTVNPDSEKFSGHIADKMKNWIITQEGCLSDACV